VLALGRLRSILQYHVRGNVDSLFRDRVEIMATAKTKIVCRAFDSFAPAHSASGLPVYVARYPSAPFCETPFEGGV